MKKKEKRIILILLVVLFILVAVLVVRRRAASNANIVPNPSGNANVNEEAPYVEKQIDVSEEFKSERKFEELDVKNVQLVESDDIVMFRADFTNTTSEVTPQSDIKVTLLNAQGKVIDEMFGLLLSVQPGETTQISVATYNKDSKDAYDYKIEVISSSEAEAEETPEETTETTEEQ